MWIVFKFIVVAIFVFWLLRFFSATLNVYWQATIGAFIHWVNTNGHKMMWIVAGLGLLLILWTYIVWS